MPDARRRAALAVDFEEVSFVVHHSASRFAGEAAVRRLHVRTLVSGGVLERAGAGERRGGLGLTTLRVGLTAADR
jgi:hypothetical protein